MKKKRLVLGELKTPEDMLDYIIEYLKTGRSIYRKGERRYSFYTEVINDLDILKESFEIRHTENTCVCCGRSVPEGNQVCPICMDTSEKLRKKFIQKELNK